MIRTNKLKTNYQSWFILLVCLTITLGLAVGGCGGGGGGGSSAPNPPAQASAPNPVSGTVNVPITQTLSWTTATGAVSYDIYLGTTFTGWTAITNTAQTTYQPAPLNNNTLYYWRVDAKNAGGTTSGITWNFTTITLYTLTYIAGTGGIINGTSSQEVNSGGNGTTVTATATTGYHFTGWSDGVTTTSRADTNITANLTVTANFAINTYTLTYSAGAGGTISGASLQTVNYGANGAAVTAQANTGYHFVNWSDASTTNPRTDTNITANLTVTANFAINTYALTYSAGAGGTISGASLQTVNYGANGAAVTAQANTGYHFVNWSDANTDNPRTDTNVTANITVTANFTINTYTLTYIAGTGGTISGTSPQTVSYGDNGSIVTAIPVTNYHFVNWSDANTNNPRTDTNVAANITVTANFAINTFTLTYIAGTGGAISGTSPQTINYGNDGAAVMASANTGYHFVDWSDASTTNPRTDTNVTANLTITANFAINTYTLTYIAGAGGTISGTSPQTVSYGDNGSIVTAIPVANYHFVSWSDASTDNPRTDTNVTTNVTVTANFAINTFTLTYIAGTGGTISGTSPQTIDYGANGSEIMAIPELSYHFVSWSDGVTTTSRAEMNVTASITATANFELDQVDSPIPADQSSSISSTQEFSWAAVMAAISYDVYLGLTTTDWTTPVSTTTTTTYNPGKLSYSTQYYWRIDWGNGVITSTGHIWSFTTKADSAPTLTSIPPDETTISTTQSFTYTISATDPDGDTITYSMAGTPTLTGATLDSGTGVFDWTPTDAEIGIYSVTFTATANLLIDSKSILIFVRPFDQPPVLTAPDNQTVDENTSLTFTLSATDPDGDMISYSMEPILPGATLDSSSGVFSWTPGYDIANTQIPSANFYVTFTAASGWLSDSKSITITVNNVDRPPTMSPLTDKSIGEQKEVMFFILGSDPDLDVVTISMTPTDTGATLTPMQITPDTAMYLFDWIPAAGQAGIYTFEFTASSGLPAKTTSQTITITVTGP